jgi:bifunctional ADP-heptose synthase (sugar kinase/adenylyltransferase)
VNQDILNRAFNDFQSLRILVIGDVMIDSYYWGKSDRISPEAPVPVVSVSKYEHRLGGAGGEVFGDSCGGLLDECVGGKRD